MAPQTLRIHLPSSAPVKDEHRLFEGEHVEHGSDPIVPAPASPEMKNNSDPPLADCQRKFWPRAMTSGGGVAFDKGEFRVKQA